MATLYRKYRPQNFAEVVGQNHIKLTLEHEIEAGKLAHAYIFCGPRAVGKTTLARVLAKAINCETRKAGTHEPCNKCLSCRDITDGRSLDIIEIDAASHTGVDNVRENIIASARVTPVKSKYKVFIIDEVHMLSVSSFNALLKVIEEPPAFVVFILCTTEIHKVPATVISRCQRFDFKRISVSDIVRKLEYIVKSEKIKVERSILESIARQSEGHMRDAESLLGQIVSIAGPDPAAAGRGGEKEITQEEADLIVPRSDLAEVVSLVDYLAKKDAAGAIGLINKLIDEGVDLKVFLNDLIEVLRKIMFIKINPTISERLGLELGEALEIKINEASRGLAVESLISHCEQFIKARNELKGANIPQLPVELAIIRLCLAPTSFMPLAGGKLPVSPAPAGWLRNEGGRAGEGNTNMPAKGVPANISREEIIAKWNEVLAKVKKYNHSLSFILRVCQPRDVNGNKICLAFRYKFHRDRINEASIRAIVEKVLNEVYGLPLTVEAVIDEGMETGIREEGIGGRENSEENLAGEESENNKNNEDKNKNSAEGGDMIDNLLKTFGGRVVE